MNAVAAYLDHNAGAPAAPEVVRAMAEALALGGNPSSVHRAGRLARRLVEESRAAIADLVGVRPAEVVFTSGGTEANHLALRGPVLAGAVARVIVSAVEHESVGRPAAALGLPVDVLPVDADGVVDLDALDALLARPGRPLVSVMLANNETGVIQPLAEIAARVKAAGGLVHTDAAQAPGRMSVNVNALGIDLMSLSGHKMGGPAGIGALVVCDGVPFAADRVGGGQEMGRRAGTENLAGIAGFGAAARIAENRLAKAVVIEALRDDMEFRARTLVPAATIHGAGAPRLCNTSCIGVAGVPAETQVIALDLAGVQVSAGAACSSGKVRPSPVLAAMGLAPEEAASAIRVSLGPETSVAEIDRFLDAWIEFISRAPSRTAPRSRRASTNA
jgi:cysteine desulfurase